MVTLSTGQSGPAPAGPSRSPLGDIARGTRFKHGQLSRRSGVPLRPHSDIPRHVSVWQSIQVADLELQLAAHATRASKLHARLMATLDILDSDRRAYSEEISDERRQRVALHARLRFARAEVAAMEAERDSLRDGVLHLIEKGASRA